MIKKKIVMEKVEIWKDITGYEGLYQVSNFGRVKSLERIVKSCKGLTRRQFSKILNPTKGDEYAQIFLCRDNKCKIFKVHRLVALEFCEGYSVGLIINHKDGNKWNNCAENLEWVTYKQNNHHARATGLIIPPKGEDNKTSKLKEHQVLEIINLRGSMGIKDLAREYNVSEGAINGILRGVTWRHITNDIVASREKI